MRIQKTFLGSVKNLDVKNHRADIFISTGDIDRDMEIINPSAFSKRLASYLAHPVLLSSHQSDTLMRQIGQLADPGLRFTQDGVIGRYEWFAGLKNEDGSPMNPEADWGWFLVTRGIAAFSVGFIAHAWQDKFTTPPIAREDAERGIVRRFTDVELLENSQVLVPANPSALQRRFDEANGIEKELCAAVLKSLNTQEEDLGVIFQEYRTLKKLRLRDVIDAVRAGARDALNK